MNKVNSVFVGDNVRYSQGMQTVEQFVIGWVKSQNRSIKIGDLIVSCRTDKTKNDEDSEAKMILQALDGIPGMKEKIKGALADIQNGKLSLKDVRYIDAVALVEKLDKQDYFKLSADEKPKVMSKTLENMGLVKTAEEKKPVEKSNAKPVAPNTAETAKPEPKSAEKPAKLEDFLETEGGKKFDETVKSHFDIPATEPDLSTVNSKITDLERKMYENNLQFTYKDMDDATKIIRPGLFSNSYDHPLKAEDRKTPDKTFIYDSINDDKTRENAAQSFKTEGNLFLKLFVTQAKTAENPDAQKAEISEAQKAEITAALADNVIDEKEAFKFGYSKQLFDLIDGNTDVNGVRDGKITLGDIKRFNEVIDAYTEVLCHGDRDLAIELYRTAPAFKMIDLETAKRTADKIGTDWEISDKTTYLQLQEKVKPDLLPALRIEMARLRNIKPEEVEDGTVVGRGNAKKICLFVASLALISQLDPKIQEKLLGVKLPRIFNDEVTEDSILKYVKNETAVKKEEGIKQEEKAKETKSEAKTPMEEPVKTSPKPQQRKDSTPAEKAIRAFNDYQVALNENDIQAQIRSLSTVRHNISATTEGMKTRENYDSFQAKLPEGHILKGKTRDKAIEMMNGKITELQKEAVKQAKKH